MKEKRRQDNKSFTVKQAPAAVIHQAITLKAHLHIAHKSSTDF
jgi:hypothetical protein